MSPQIASSNNLNSNYQNEDKFKTDIGIVYDVVLDETGNNKDIEVIGAIKFRFNDDFGKLLFEKYKTEFPEEPVCGLQIRRGEIVPKDGDINKSWKIRELFSLDDYMVGAKEVCNKLGTKTIFVSSDSSETLDYLEENYSDYNFIVNKYDRSLFVRFQGDPSKVNLERDLQLNPKLIEHYTETCLIDLYMLSQCQGFVGGMKHSEYGVCGWFLQMIEQKSITPYYNLEGEFELNGSPVGMLLN